MKTIAVSRLLLSNTFILNCQIASLLAVILLLSDITDASEVAPVSSVCVVLSSTGTENYLR